MVAIIPRAQWGARAAKSVSGVPLSSREAIMIHHSEGPSTQTPAQIQAYHQNSNGWADIGYNFLIDPDGNVYEGRGRDVLGAHCTGWNTKAIGVCFIGSYGDTPPTSAALTSGTALIAQLRADAGRNLRVMGHRDGLATACPGNALYACLGQLAGGAPAQVPAPTVPASAPAPQGVTAPPFPLPAGYCYGPRAGDNTVVSGQVARRDGLTGEGLKVWQTRMRERGWMSVIVSGQYDAATKAAAHAFQVEKGLAVDDLIGKQTWDAAWTAPVTP